jgi:hypothetical protein
LRSQIIGNPINILQHINREREILIAKKGVKQGVINMVFDFVGKKPK